MTEMRETPEPSLCELIAQLAPVDLIIIEGYKRDTHSKIETFRKEIGQDLIARNDTRIKAIASDTPELNIDRPILDLNDTTSIADFVLNHAESALPDQKWVLQQE